MDLVEGGVAQVDHGDADEFFGRGAVEGEAEVVGYDADVDGEVVELSHELAHLSVGLLWHGDDDIIDVLFVYNVMDVLDTAEEVAIIGRDIIEVANEI